MPLVAVSAWQGLSVLGEVFRGPIDALEDALACAGLSRSIAEGIVGLALRWHGDASAIRKTSGRLAAAAPRKTKNKMATSLIKSPQRVRSGPSFHQGTVLQLPQFERVAASHMLT